jgi:hypothetical protein
MNRMMRPLESVTSLMTACQRMNFSISPSHQEHLHLHGIVPYEVLAYMHASSLPPPSGGPQTRHGTWRLL